MHLYFSIISQYWDGRHIWNIEEEELFISYIVNTMTADVLVMQGIFQKVARYLFHEILWDLISQF